MINEIRNILLVNVDDLERRNIATVVQLIAFFYADDKANNSEVLSPVIFELLQSCLVKSEAVAGEDHVTQVGLLLLHLFEQSIFEIEDLNDIIDNLDKIILKNIGSIQQDTLQSEVLCHYLMKRNRVSDSLDTGFKNLEIISLPSETSLTGNLSISACAQSKQTHNDSRIWSQLALFLKGRGSMPIQKNHSILDIDECIFFYLDHFKTCTQPSLSSTILLDLMLLGLVKISKLLSVIDREFANIIILSLIDQELKGFKLQMEALDV